MASKNVVNSLEISLGSQTILLVLTTVIAAAVGLVFFFWRRSSQSNSNPKPILFLEEEEKEDEIEPGKIKVTIFFGTMALSAAAVNDVAAWILLALAVALSSKGHSPLISLYVLLSGFGFIASAVLILRPIFSWMVKRCPEGEPIDGIYICVSLAIALGAGFVTDAIGIHAIFGGFVAGVIVQKEGHFAGALVEKVEDLVSGLFLPLYFASSGTAKGFANALSEEIKARYHKAV